MENFNAQMVDLLPNHYNVAQMASNSASSSCYTHQEPLRCFSSHGRVLQHRRCQVAQPCVSPSLIALRTYLMVADALTKSDVSRPTDAFRNICMGGQICIRDIVDAKLLNCASLHRLFRVGATVYLPDIYESHLSRS
jgi:hypothetical protein